MDDSAAIALPDPPLRIEEELASMLSDSLAGERCAAEPFPDGDGRVLGADAVVLLGDPLRLSKTATVLSAAGDDRPFTFLWLLHGLAARQVDPARAFRAAERAIRAIRWTTGRSAAEGIRQGFRPRPMPRRLEVLLPFLTRGVRRAATARPGADGMGLLSGLLRTAGIASWAEGGLLDVAASATPDRLPSLSQWIESRLLPVGYHPGMGTDRGGRRDIPVLFLGSITPRRGVALEYLQTGLASFGIDLTVVDRGCFGEERTALLNRTLISLNLSGSPGGGNVPHDRMILSMGCGALVVTEPATGLDPMVPGTHMIAASVEEMPGVIARYLDRPEERRRIVGAARALLQSELSMGQTARRMAELWRSR